jgi:uncharacterized SAM-binding protein YcdF (DUF218 family)
MDDKLAARSSVDDSPAAPRVGPGRLLRRAAWATILFCVVTVLALAAGFAWFVAILPAQEVKIDRRADGIAVLTGGGSRVLDALELLSDKRGTRLLISGANRSTDAKEIMRLHPEFQSVVRCCVDFDRSLNTLGNAVETRKWAKKNHIRSLIVVTSGYHMPRALAEIGHQLPGVTLIAFPVFSEQLKAEPWWTDGLRRVGLEYLKYVFAHVRMRLNPGAGKAE